jgi:hypothetical protein
MAHALRVPFVSRSVSTRHGQCPVPAVPACLIAAAMGLASSSPLRAHLVGIFADGFESGDTSAWSAVVTPPCLRRCEALELCDPAHRGFDDDCNGVVDEGCACTPGTAQGCFAGDPSYYGTPGCFAGVQHCSATGAWGACVGGVDALAGCYLTDPTACHAIATQAFFPSDLSTGLGNFGTGALSESWEVTCPDAFASCALPAPPPSFQPVAVGEHGVLYTKMTVGGPEQCTYSLFAGGPGSLRVELHWENDLGGSGVDLDLHLHRPGTTTPWGGTQGSPEDCAWDNCTANTFAVPGAGPDWFSGSQPPAPVSWYLDPVLGDNGCYFAPKGQGALWQAIGLGCHNPRLDVEQISCDPTDLDPSSLQFCAGEVSSIDFMPQLTWTRVAVHYYSAGAQTYPVHPAVKIFCHGLLAAELGPAGYYSPESPVTFSAADAFTLFWVVADVAFGHDAYGTPRCLVEPVYADAATRTPFLTTASIASTTLGPAYPPPPDFGPSACPQ